MSITHNSDGSYTLKTPITAADLDALGAGLGTTTTPPPVTTPPPSTNFKIFAFNNMSNPSLFSDNPSVVGTTITDYWARLNPQQGVYAWDIIDGYIKPWADAGKQIILRISTSGHTNWQTDLNSKQGTPQWVLDQGVPHVTASDKSVKPQYWNGKFLDALSDFVKVPAARYDGNKNILCVEIGVGDGGETKPDTSNDSNMLARWQAIGYTDANWWTAIQAIIGMYTAYFKQTPLALMPDSSFLKGDPGYDEAKVVNYAAQFGVWMQWNGLVAGGKLPGSFGGLKKNYPLILEQLNAAGPNKRKLPDDLQAMIDLGAVVALVFSLDLSDPNNATTLAKFAAMVSKSS